MSWSVSFFAKTKEGAIKKVREEQEKSADHFPKPAADLLCERIDALTKPTWCPDPVIRVDSSGHFDTNYGDAKFAIGWTSLVE